MAVVLGLALALSASHPNAHTKTTQVTWTVDVGPILQARCAGCHRTGGFGGPPLGTYAEARTWVRAIREEVLSGRMPPWTAVRGFGDFSNDASLSPVEVELIASWADGGAPLGPEVVTPRTVAKPAADGARAARFDLPAVVVSGASIETFALPVASAGDRWMSGWQFDPGNRSLVEEAVLSIRGTAVAAWTPFDARIDYPRGVAQRLPRGADVAVAVRYRKPPEPQEDRSALTLYLGPRPSREVRHRLVGCGSHIVERDISLLAVKPRPAAAGDPMEVVAYGPGDVVEPLTVVSRYMPEYALTYRLRVPLPLERGSRLDVRSSSPGCTATIDYLDRESRGARATIPSLARGR